MSGSNALVSTCSESAGVFFRRKHEVAATVQSSTSSAVTISGLSRVALQVNQPVNAINPKADPRRSLAKKGVETVAERSVVVTGVNAVSL